MKVKIVYSEECPHCAELKQKLAAQHGIDGIDIDMVEAQSDEGIIISEAYGLDVIPTAVNDVGICEITYISGKVDIVCPE